MLTMTTMLAVRMPEEVRQSIKLQAAAEGVSVQAWVLARLAVDCTAQVVAGRLVEEAPEAGNKERAQVSPRGRSSLSEAPTKAKRATKRRQVEKQAEEAPAEVQRKECAPVEMKPCSHGLLWHPGCTDGS